MSKYHYFVRVTLRTNDTEFNGREARAYRQPNNYNMMNAVYNSEHIKTEVIHICSTAKEAVELSNFWNRCYVDNKTYPEEFTHGGKPIYQHTIDNLY